MTDKHTPILVSIRDCCDLTSLSRTYINKLRTERRFPEAVSLGDRRVAFVRTEVEQWIRDRIAEREATSLPISSASLRRFADAEA